MRSTLSLVAGALALGLAPDPELDAVAWAKAHIVVPDGPYAGQKWRGDIDPCQADVLRCLSPQDPCTRVTVRKSAQTGLTGIGIAWLGLIADRYPGTTLVVQPTTLALADFNKEKLQPTIDNSPALKSKIADQISRDGKGSSSKRKVFPGGSITLTHAGSSAALRSKTIKYVLADEIDEYPSDLDGQGDPMAMIDARQFSFRLTGNYKKFEISTPTLKGESRIDDGFEAGDQRYKHTACPECGEVARVCGLDFFDQIHGNDSWPYQATWTCPANGCVVPGHRKKEMVQAARMIATNPGPGRHPSFQFDTPLSPVLSWDDLWGAYLDAKRDPTKLKSFYNLWLGISFEQQGEAPAWELLRNRANAIAHHARCEVPAEVLFLTAGVDVQADRLEAGIWGFGFGKQPYAIDHRVLVGDTNGLEVWAELGALWQQTFPTADGAALPIAAMAVDSGYRPSMAYEFARGKPNCISIKGASGRTEYPIGRPKKQYYTPRGKLEKRSVQNWLVGSWYLKAELYGLLNLEGPSEAGTFPPGFVHLPTGMEEDWFQQLVAEKLVPKQQRGGAVSYEWIKAPGQRNEVLDCAVYARAAAYWLGMGQWTGQQWVAMAERRGAAVPDRHADLLQQMRAPVPAAGEVKTRGEVKPGGEPGSSHPAAAPPPKRHKRRTRSSMF